MIFNSRKIDVKQNLDSIESVTMNGTNGVMKRVFYVRGCKG